MKRLKSLSFAFLVTVLAFALPTRNAHSQNRMDLAEAIRQMITAQENGKRPNLEVMDRVISSGMDGLAHQESGAFNFRVDHPTEGMKSKGINRFSYAIVPMEGESWGVFRYQYIYTPMAKNLPREASEIVWQGGHGGSESRIGDAQQFKSLPEALDHVCQAANKHTLPSDRRVDWKLHVRGGDFVSTSEINLVGNLRNPNQIFEFTLNSGVSPTKRPSSGSLRDALLAVHRHAKDAGLRSSSTLDMITKAATQLGPEHTIISKGAFAESVRQFRASLVQTILKDAQRETKPGGSKSRLSAATEQLLIDFELGYEPSVRQLDHVQSMTTAELETLAKQLRQESRVIREAPRPDEAIRTLADPNGNPGKFDQAIAQAVQQLEMEVTWRKLESAITNLARTGKLGEEAKSISRSRLWIRDAQFLETLEKGGEAGKSLALVLRKSLKLEESVRAAQGITIESVHDLPGSVAQFEIGESISGISRRELGELRLPEGIHLNAILDQGGVERTKGVLGLEGALQSGISVIGVSTEPTGGGGTEIKVIRGTIREIKDKVLVIDAGGESVEIPRNRTILYSLSVVNQESSRPSNPQMGEAVAQIAAEGGHRADVIAARDGGQLKSELDRHSLENLSPRDRMAEIRTLLEHDIREYAKKR